MKEPPWLHIARSDIGNPESLGPNDSPLIRRMLARLRGMWLKGQPWCGCAVAWWMQQADISFPKAYYRAKAWLDWGCPIASPVVGAVAVFEREGGGHVGLVVGLDQRGRLLILGGNQRNCVGIDPIDVKRVLGYRWPLERLSVMRTEPPPVLSSVANSSDNEA